MPLNLVNATLFNISWLAIVLGQTALIAVPVAAIHVLLHLRLMGRPLELEYIILVALAGALIDQVLFHTGVLTVAGSPGPAPLWISCLWPVLATTFMHAFAVLRKCLPLAAIVGALGGGGSYLAGTRLTEVSFGLPHGVLLLALLWAALFPLLLYGTRYVRPKPGGEGRAADC